MKTDEGALFMVITGLAHFVNDYRGLVDVHVSTERAFWKYAAVNQNPLHFPILLLWSSPAAGVNKSANWLGPALPVLGNQSPGFPRCRDPDYGEEYRLAQLPPPQLPVKQPRKSRTAKPKPAPKSEPAPSAPEPAGEPAGEAKTKLETK